MWFWSGIESLETWRTQRWNSFRLNTPGWMNQMLGEQAHREFLDGAEVIHHLETLAAERPVRQAVRVDELAPSSDGYVMQTEDGMDSRPQRDRGHRRPESCRGCHQWPKRCPTRSPRYHTGSYRGPGSLPAGGALVVGSAQSGCQIAEDLALPPGRRVVDCDQPGCAPALAAPRPRQPGMACGCRFHGPAATRSSRIRP